ncbi:OLC1v1004000C1 [Oldenlandia corymbosa var. corymbosa]|uniref:OLC1v1004000C1 n=1 Tax=Oldenlandia corymbosa var. corymbosa TaxID=529605 RepID=A0AAV1DD48_OLDCO|nr:OLC1v1004000C1 [Oldenlandia corymbosa var. corymbosa]
MPASYPTKYFGIELGTQSRFDERTQASLLDGFNDAAKLDSLLHCKCGRFYFCKKPKAIMAINKKQMIELRCVACGLGSNLDMNDKLATFNLNNPPGGAKKDPRSTPMHSRVKMLST